jgi:ketosteroid isomerase-like protein
MRLRLAQFLVLAMTAGLAACSGSNPSQEFGKTDIAQISQAVKDFVAAYNAKDVEKIGSFFSGNASIMPANRSTLRGVDAIKGFFKERLTVDGATDLAVEVAALEGHGPLAYYAGTFSLTLKPADGSERRDRGKVIWILRKLGGNWKVEYQIMSSDLPPVVPPPPPEPPVK